MRVYRLLGWLATGALVAAPWEGGLPSGASLAIDGLILAVAAFINALVNA